MKKDINFIGAEVKKTLEFVKLKKKFKKLSILISCLFIVAVFFILTFFILLKRNLNSSNQKILLLKDQLKNLTKNESYIFTILDRSEKIKQIIKDEKSYSQALADIESLFVPGFSLKKLDYQKKSGIKISAICENTQSLTNFNERLEQIKTNKKFTDVLFKSIVRKNDNNYSFDLELK